MENNGVAVNCETYDLDTNLKVGLKIKYFLCSFFMGICSAFFTRNVFETEVFTFFGASLFLAVTHNREYSSIKLNFVDDYNNKFTKLMLVVTLPFNCKTFLVDFAYFNEVCSKALVHYLNNGWKFHYNRLMDEKLDIEDSRSPEEIFEVISCPSMRCP